MLFQDDSLERLIAPLYKETEIATVMGACGVGIKGSQDEEGIRECYSLDEFCVAMSRDTFECFRFNEEICDGWHLYAVELCIRVRQNGGRCLSADTGIQHLSIGNVDEKYMKLYRRLQKEYPDERIATTCKSLPRNAVLFYGYYGIWKIKRSLLGNYPLGARIKKLLSGAQQEG